MRAAGADAKGKDILVGQAVEAVEVKVATAATAAA